MLYLSTITTGRSRALWFDRAYAFELQVDDDDDDDDDGDTSSEARQHTVQHFMVVSLHKTFCTFCTRHFAQEEVGDGSKLSEHQEALGSLLFICRGRVWWAGRWMLCLATGLVHSCPAALAIRLAACWWQQVLCSGCCGGLEILVGYDSGN
jgi:hypothetical protein